MSGDSAWMLVVSGAAAGISALADLFSSPVVGRRSWSVTYSLLVRLDVVRRKARIVE